jgi:hypothetical protein
VDIERRFLAVIYKVDRLIRNGYDETPLTWRSSWTNWQKKEQSNVNTNALMKNVNGMEKAHGLLASLLTLLTFFGAKLINAVKMNVGFGRDTEMKTTMAECK